MFRHTRTLALLGISLAVAGGTVVAGISADDASTEQARKITRIGGASLGGASLGSVEARKITRTGGASLGGASLGGASLG